MGRYNNLIDELEYLFDDLSIDNISNYSKDELDSIQEIRNKLFSLYSTMIKHKQVYRNHKHKNVINNV